MIIPILSIFAFCPVYSIPFQHCKSDSDCYQPNFYCYESRECVECTNCSFYNKLPSSVSKCAKNKDQCGLCISGMEPETNFDGTLTCQPQIAGNATRNYPPPTSNQNQDSNEQNKYLGLYISIPLSVIIIIIICLILVVKYKIWQHFKRFLPSNYENCPANNNNHLPPPPYTEKSPSAPPEPEEDPLIARRVLIEDNSQRAIPSHPPNYVSGGTYSEYPPPPQPSPQPQEPEDENTQPSAWFPDPSENQPISFQNILQENTPHPQNDHTSNQNTQNTTNESSNQPNPQFNFVLQIVNSQTTKIN